MEAVVLAGGLGTRLRDVVKDIPKPMASVNDRPFLEYLLDYLKNNNVTRIILAVGYKWEVIEEHFGHDYKGVNLQYSVETEPLGTGGAIKKALEKCEGQNVFIINGDTYFDVNLTEMLNQHENKKAALTIATKLMKNFDRYGTVKCDKDRIIKFEEKKFTQEGNINGGIYICKRDILEAVSKEKFSFEKDVMEEQVNSKYLSSYKSEGYFMDIGIPSDYRQFEKDMKRI